MASNKNFHNKAFDEGTNCKLALYRQYLRAWIPTFLNNKWIRHIKIFDFFAGPGTDGSGNPASPLLAAEEIKLALDKHCEKHFLDKKISLYLNELNVEKYTTLQSTANRIRTIIPDVNITVTNVDFATLFQEYLPLMEASETANFIFIDQFGLKEVTENVFRKLTSLPHTDFMFYLAAATANRFKDLQAIVKYLPPLTEQEKQEMDGNNVLRILADSYNENWAPRGYFLGQYSIKKSSNVYGLIFGSGHPAGIEKFLQETWKMGGDANFDIDNDNIDDLQPNLFAEYNIPSKVRDFQKNLIWFLRKRPSITNRDLYIIAVRNGMLSSHVRDVIKKLQKEGFILNPKINVSYSSWAKKTPPVQLKYSDDEGLGKNASNI